MNGNDTCKSLEPVNRMSKLYFLGGENIFRQDSREINALAFEDAGLAPTIAVFSWARASFDLSYKRRKRLFDYFRSLGAVQVNFVDYSETPRVIAATMAQSDLVYLTGGQLSCLVSRLKSKKVDGLLKTYGGVIVGRSAGAMVMGRHGIVTERYSCRKKVVTGLNLVNFSVKAHYYSSMDNMLKILSKTERVYALPNGSAIIYNDGSVSFVGNVTLFQDGEKC